MDTKKKIVICGSPSTGKTKFTEVFLKKANPLKLLRDALEPTRGVNSGIFSVFNSQLSIFDLAGQENETWFSSDMEVFQKSNLILCFFDINNSIEKIISFLVDLLNIKKRSQSLFNCNIIALIPKIDLVSPFYISQKIRAIRKFFENHYPLENSIEIKNTSISKKHFYKTYRIIMNIFNMIFKKQMIPMRRRRFENLKKELLLIIKTVGLIKYRLDKLAYKFNMSRNLILKHLKRLERIGFVEFLDDFEIVRFSERCRFFKIGFLREVKKIDLMRENPETRLFYTFQKIYIAA
jgi:GTPase SAR1 family protein